MSNSPVTETGYSAEYLQDGVYSITTTTCYNAAGQPLSSVQKQLISQLSGTLESKSVFVSERGLTSTQWTVYSGGTKRVQYSTVPGSSITAETVTVDGVVRSQKDTAGITTTATRPLAIQKDGTWYTYGWDLTKNICELYGPAGYIRTAYTYSPYGQVTSTGDVEQTIQWSSEYNDTELGLIYYNYRHYNPVDGRWIGRDKMAEIEYLKLLVYNYGDNSPLALLDVLGLDSFSCNMTNVNRYKDLIVRVYLQTFDGYYEVVDTKNADIGQLLKKAIIDKAKGNAILSPDKFVIMRLKRLPEYFAQASYSAVEELYKSKVY